MSDKSRDVEPDHDEIVDRDPDATPEDVTPDGLVDEPEDLAAAEAAVSDPELEGDPQLVGRVGDHAGPEARDTTREDDERIAQLEEDFTPEEQAAAAAAPGIARKTAKAPVRRKDAPTRRRSAALAEEEDPYKASNPAEFVGQSAAELKKVVWPTWPQLTRMFAAVLIFVLIIITIVALLDLAFGWALLQLFGN